MSKKESKLREGVHHFLFNAMAQNVPLPERVSENSQENEAKGVAFFMDKAHWSHLLRTFRTNNVTSR